MLHFLLYQISCAAVLGPLWQTFVSGLNVYERASVQGMEESFAGMADSDGTDQSLESFAIQVQLIVLPIHQLMQLKALVSLWKCWKLWMCCKHVLCKRVMICGHFCLHSSHFSIHYVVKSLVLNSVLNLSICSYLNFCWQLFPALASARFVLVAWIDCT